MPTTMDREPEQFVYLRDQLPLSTQQWVVAEMALAFARDAIEHRVERVHALGLDEDLWIPASELDRNRALRRNFDALCDLGNVPLLRMFCHPLTGYRLCWLGQRGQISADISSEELDQRFAALQESAEKPIDSYLERAVGLPEYLCVSPPAMFGEVGWRHGGALINHDTQACLERLALLYQAGFLDHASPRSLLRMQQPRILEIGGGYGGLAYLIKQILPGCHYTIVDLPESLAFSGVYLSALYHQQDIRFGGPQPDEKPEPGCAFLPNFEFPSLADSGASFDLVINTASFSEMSEGQIRAYCEGLSRLIRNTGYLFEQNPENRCLEPHAVTGILQEHFYHRLDLGEATSIAERRTFSNLTRVAGGLRRAFFRTPPPADADQPRPGCDYGEPKLWANQPIPRHTSSAPRANRRYAAAGQLAR